MMQNRSPYKKNIECNLSPLKVNWKMTERRSSKMKKLITTKSKNDYVKTLYINLKCQ